MRQVVQDLRSGKLDIEDVPAPVLLETSLLVVNEYSVISAGTERATVDLARKNLVAKARARPDLVKKVLQSMQRDGIVETARMVSARLDRSSRLGYSCAGIVAAVGSEVHGFAVGDRVACAGQDQASHAEVVCVPANLCVHVPASVASEDACYVALGAIALQAVRQAAPNIGETVAVIGLGLVGQLVSQLLRANGCRVIASDLDATKLSLARELGAHRVAMPDALIAACAQETEGRGVDAVILTASTPSNEPIEAAGHISRQKGRVVVVGAVGMQVPREPYYRKELELRLSTSYGPGRYDAAYETGGIDYPYGFVRWTEGRNLAAFLNLLQDRRVDVSRLTSHRFGIADAQAAYEVLHAGEPCLGIVLAYPRQSSFVTSPAVRLRPPVAAPKHAERIRIALIGPGNHLQDRLLPHLRSRRDVMLYAVCAGNGVNAKRVAQSIGAEYCTTDYREVLADPSADAVVVSTRHDSHARIVCDALEAGKHVFVEKPLCLTESDLAEIDRAYGAASAERNRILFVGFNRRYSPHVIRIGEFFANRSEPLALSYRVNAGPLAPDHWMNAQGGRLLGETCHFIDTIAAVAGTPARVNAVTTGGQLMITLELADGSIASILYTGDGDPDFPKERLEVFGGGKTAVLDDFSMTTLHEAGRQRRFKTRPRDKGFANEMAAFLDCIARGACGDTLFDTVRVTTLATLRAQASLADREPKDV